MFGAIAGGIASALAGGAMSKLFGGGQKAASGGIQGDVLATDRSRARRCVEACVYGTLDFVGYPRFPAPVEFIAAVIAYYVHPVNIQTACLIMEGAEFTENIINGVERPVKAAELFAFTLRVRAGNTDVLTDAEENVRQKLR